MRQFEVPKEKEKKRLDVWLASTLKQPRHQVQKLIKDGLVKVDNKITSVHHWLFGGEIVEVTTRKQTIPSAPPPLSIIAETRDYLVVLKPNGVVVHPARGSNAPVLTAALVNYCHDIAKVGDRERPGIVHRLDRDVAGLMVVAKNQDMYDHLITQFKQHKVLKRYTALVHGVVASPEGVINFVLARSKTHPGRMAARPKTEEGKESETKYTVIKRFAHYTLLELVLTTGRMHQIRAHLKAFGHHIVGDALYGRPQKSGKQISALDQTLNRPFLEATTLGFFDLNNKWQEYIIPLDNELQNFLTLIS